MGITVGSRIQVQLSFLLNNNIAMNVWSYAVFELAGVPTAANYAEAWWNHVKGNYRALAATNFGSTFQSIRVTELGVPDGEYGEYPIPSGERTGTRTPPADPMPEPVFLAAGVRLTVGARSTRPGQKRFSWLTQSDAEDQNIGSAYQALLVTLMNTMKAPMTLGAPAAGVVLTPIVVGLNADGSIRASQPITGYVIDGVATSQVSRRIGRGI